MRVEEVVDKETLETYLDALPEEEWRLASRRVALLTAMRVAPAGLQCFAQRPKTAERELTALPMLMALSYSRFGAEYPSLEYDLAAANAAANVTASAAHSVDVASAGVDAAASLAVGAAYAAAHAAVSADPGIDAAYAAANTAYAAANGVGWELVRQVLVSCAAMTEGDLPALWVGLEEPAAFKTAWDDARAALLSDQMVGEGNPSWRVFVLMIDRIRAGRDIHVQVLADCLEGLKREEIEGDPALVLPRLDPLLDIYEREDAALASSAPSTALAEAYPVEFDFDDLAKVMRIIGIADDNAHLRKPEIVQAFCDDAEEVRDALQDFADYVSDITGTGNYAGVLKRAADKVLAEFTWTEDQTHLRARRVVKLAQDLEFFAQDEGARADIKRPLAKMLDEALVELKTLCRKHFGPSYLALAPLADLSLEHVDKDAVLALFDDVIAQFEAGTRSDVVPLDAEGQAILQSMLRELHESRALLGSVTSEEFKSILENRFAQNSGAFGLALNRYAEQSYVALGTVHTTGKKAVEAHKTVKGLMDILKAVGITFGGGTAL